MFVSRIEGCSITLEAGSGCRTSRCTWESPSCTVPGYCTLRALIWNRHLTVYLDNMAATPVDPRIAEHHAAMMLALPANAHSGEHSHGAEAGAAIDTAADGIAAFADCNSADVHFTPGASPALWAALEDVLERTTGRPARVLVSAAEHPTLIAHVRRAERAGRAEVVFIPVDKTGAPEMESLVAAFSGAADLICTMAANNEVGTVTDLAPIVAFAREAGSKLLVDASQAAGRVPITDAVMADYLILSGAKMYGPRRVGVLIGRLADSTAQLAKAMFGSPDAAGASAMALACNLRALEMADDEDRLAAMRDRLQSFLEDNVPGVVVNGDQSARLAGSLHVSAPGMPGEVVVARLWDQVALSTGAACQSGAPGPSHVLSAMGLPEWVADAGVRIGIGRFNTEDEVEAAATLIGSAMAPVKARMRA